MRRRAVFTSCHFWLSTAEEMLSSIVSQQVGKMRQGGAVGELQAYKCKFNVITRPRGPPCLLISQLHPASERNDVLLGRVATIRN